MMSSDLLFCLTKSLKPQNIKFYKTKEEICGVIPVVSNTERQNEDVVWRVESIVDSVGYYFKYVFVQWLHTYLFTYVFLWCPYDFIYQQLTWVESNFSW